MVGWLVFGVIVSVSWLLLWFSGILLIVVLLCVMNMFVGLMFDVMMCVCGYSVMVVKVSRFVFVLMLVILCGVVFMWVRWLSIVR